jgi:hypothetical protein
VFAPWARTQQDIDAADIKTGTLPSARLPALTGDVTTTAGSAVTTLSSAAPALVNVANSHAARQWLFFDGTAGATVAPVPAFGTGDFTVVFTVCPTGFPANYCEAIWGYGGAPILSFTTSGTLRVGKSGLVPHFISAATAAIGRVDQFAITRVGGVMSALKNGQLVDSVSGDTTNYTQPLSVINRAALDQEASLPGRLTVDGIYNRGLLSTEVTDYFATQKLPSWATPATAPGEKYATDFSTSAGWSFAPPSEISGGKLFLGNAVYAAGPNATAMVAGQRYFFTITVESLTAGNICFFDGQNYIQFAESPGTYQVDFTAVAASGAIFLKTGGGDAVCDNFSFSLAGALFLPDQSEPGLGPQWRGYGAQINLPGDGVTGGVTWAQPSAQRASFTAMVTGSGYLLGRDGRHIPPGCVIDSIYAKGNGTFSLGGSGADLTSVVNGQEATATAAPVTLAGRTTTTGKLYGTLGTATNVVLTIDLKKL